MEITIPKNFFGEDIPLTVFVSQEQLHDASSTALYGKYFPDTGIFNVFPPELNDRGEFLGPVLAREAHRIRRASAPSPLAERSASSGRAARSRRKPMACTRVFSPGTAASWRRMS